MQVAVCLCAVLAGVPAAIGQDLDLQLWIAWGGGAARQWTGSIRVDGVRSSSSGKTFNDLRAVGLSPDEPGSMYIRQDALYIQPRTPRTYDAVRLSVNASQDATLTIDLTPSDQPDQARRFAVPLARLVSEAHSSVLDDRGNRMLVRRAPGDELRLRFDRESLVFESGESFDLHVDPHLVDVGPDTALVYRVELRPARSDEVLWDDQREARSDAVGDPPEVGPFSIPLPEAEGVYDVVVHLNRRRLPTRFAPTKLVAQRSLQLVVLGSQAIEPDRTAWQVVDHIAPVPDAAIAEEDASHGHMWQSLPKLPEWTQILPKWSPKLPDWTQLRWFSSSKKKENRQPLGNGKSQKLVRSTYEFVGLEPGGWQAYPLSIEQPGAPHVLELQYPSDQQQTLGIWILEPNAAGVVTPLGVNSGVDVRPAPDASTPRLEVHRIVFWPRTGTPLLVLANYRNEVPATFGSIRVLAGPKTLPARQFASPEPSRLLGAYFDRPLIAECFSASDAVDPITKRNLNDWGTFYDGGVRLAQYLKYQGQNGAMISVLHEGGTLYPSRLLQPIPKYDNGAFFGTGQDPVPKDVLEMLFRLFDREGLRLVPALRFSAPLPELETLVRLPDAGEPSGIELVGADGRSWRQAFGSEQAVGPLYNPLDPAVQQAMRHVVQELIERYGQHRSFAGVAIQLGPDTYAQLPDAPWGQDAVTLARFAKAEGIVLPGQASGDREQTARYLDAEGSDRWMNWRAGELAGFYRSLQEHLTARVPDARLYLAGADMLTGKNLRRALRPTLPERLDVRHAMLRVGIDPHRYRDMPEIVLLRPQRLAPIAPLERQAANIELQRSEEMDNLFHRIAVSGREASAETVLRPETGSLFFQKPVSLSLPSLASTSPFGSDRTTDWLLAHIGPVGQDNRERFIHSLATSDAQSLFDGGWMATLGHQESLTRVVEVYRRLPAERFETIPSHSASGQRQPVVVRRLTRAGQTYLYVVNDSPWPLSVTLDLKASRPFDMAGLGLGELPPIRPQGDGLVWTLAVAPYDVVGAVLGAPDVEISDWRVAVGSQVFASLREAINDIRARTYFLRNPQALPVLTNADFELPGDKDSPPGWNYTRNDGVSIALDPAQDHTNAAGDGGGGHALRIRSSGPVAWVRSNPFPTPKTGRLAVWVWLRIADPTQQPPLQLAIEGRLNGKPYYRPARVGANEGRANPPPPALSDRWAPYLVRVDNLPTEGLTDLRVAVDLMGKGEVWVDDIRVFDLWFDKTERNELLKKIALADWKLGNGEVMECERILNSYWAEFLRRYVPRDQLEVAHLDPPHPARQPGRPASDPAGAEQHESPPSWIERLTPRIPRLPRFFR